MWNVLTLSRAFFNVFASYRRVSLITTCACLVGTSIQNKSHWRIKLLFTLLVQGGSDGLICVQEELPNASNSHMPRKHMVSRERSFGIHSLIRSYNTILC